MLTKKDFKQGDFVVYPSHGLGIVKDITKQKFGNKSIELVVVLFEKSRMTLKIPVDKIENSGLRKLSQEKDMKSAVLVIKKTPRIKRMMWSRRATEYEEKINSGNTNQVAEVVRDLHSRASRPEQSFSERQIYEQALLRLAEEYGAVYGLPSNEASTKLKGIMDKELAKHRKPDEDNGAEIKLSKKDLKNLEKMVSEIDDDDESEE